MIGIVHPLQAWNRFWFAPISAKPLGAFRIAFGLTYLFNLALLTIDMDYWFTNQGLIRDGETFLNGGPHRFTLLNWVQDPPAVHAFFLAVAVVAVLFTVGWRTRIMSVLLYLGTLMFHQRNIATAGGPDTLVCILSFYLMFSPCGAAYSLDSRRETRRRGSAAEPIIIPWAQRLIQIQICLIYLVTGVLKANGATWLNGTALHYILHNAEQRRFTLGLTDYPLVLNAFTYLALMVELSLPFLLWFRSSRAFAIMLGIGLHGAILLMINIPVFGELMIVSYLTFLTAPELQSLLRRVNVMHWFRRSADPGSVPDEVDELEREAEMFHLVFSANTRSHGTPAPHLKLPSIPQSTWPLDGADSDSEPDAEYQVSSVSTARPGTSP